MKKSILMRAACVALLWVSTAQADTDTDEVICLAGRAKAAGKYLKCVQEQVGKDFLPDGDGGALWDGLARCRKQYARAWSRLQGLGTTCAVASRFTDNGNGTITDHLSGLVWEKKSSNGDVHDMYKGTSWSAEGSFDGNGTAYTTFLRDGLNAGAGFAGANDWRLPTVAELQTLVLPERYPCTSDPCIDPVFHTNCTPGCTVLTCSCTASDPIDAYWTATTCPLFESSHAFSVVFWIGATSLDRKARPDHVRVRAVRGGL